MKLIIQIPCFNEAGTLATALAELPREVPGFDRVEWLVIDDGSTDDTAAVARSNGVDHIVRHRRNMGLARTFTTGMEACLALGADVIVNTDADNQYCGADIPLLTGPLLDGTADMVIGARPIADIEDFSPIKKTLQKVGSWVVRIASRTSVPDAPSGFRALSRAAAQRMMVFSDYTYTLETIIQSGQHGLSVTSVPIRVNGFLRPSRLVSSIPSYIKRSIVTITRIFIIYRPFRFFAAISLMLLMLSIVIGVRFLLHYFNGNGEGHVQSLILAGALLGMSFQSLLIAFIADILAANRKLLEDIRFRQRTESSARGLHGQPPRAEPNPGQVE